MTRKAGSIVLDRLRERILLGRYFGCWTQGDRLPSVRDVAREEDVDRKTAAAAYRRLEAEGLVRVEPRSGVYLRNEEREDGGDPLRRLHRQWLENTLATAAQLGIDAASAIRMLQAVAAVQGRRIAVVDEDGDHAALLARELAERTGLECVGASPRAVPAEAGPLKDSPFIVATPASAARLRPWRNLPIVPATLNPALVRDLRVRATRNPVVVIVGTAGLARDLEHARRHGLTGPADRVTVLRPTSLKEIEGVPAPGQEVVIWPGAPSWAAQRLNGGPHAPVHLLDEVTLREVRHQIARAALESVSRSSGAVSR